MRIDGDNAIIVRIKSILRVDEKLPSLPSNCNVNPPSPTVSSEALGAFSVAP